LKVELSQPESKGRFQLNRRIELSWAESIYVKGRDEPVHAKGLDELVQVDGW